MQTTQATKYPFFAALFAPVADTGVPMIPAAVADKVSDAAIDLAQDYMREGQEYDPFAPDAIREALSELRADQVAELSRCYRDGKKELAASLTHSYVLHYWMALACQQAQVDVDAQEEMACKYCHDFGCPHCERREPL